MSNEIDVRNSEAITQMIDGSLNLYTSITTTEFADKIKLNNAIADALPIADHLGMWFVLADIVVQQVELTEEDETTHDLVTTSAIMVILIADDGTAYRVFSNGVFRDLQRIVKLLGEPNTWPEPVWVMVSEGRSGKNRFYNLRVATDNEVASDNKSVL